MKYDDIQERLTQVVTRKQEVIKSLEILSRQEKLVEADIQRVSTNLEQTEFAKEELVEGEVVVLAQYKRARQDLNFIAVALKQKRSTLEQMKRTRKQLNQELKVVREYEANLRKLLESEFGKVLYFDDRQRKGA